jgi:RimJ/RimL family protein N-acetyltransferase
VTARRRRARSAPADLAFGVWAIVERASGCVIGDAGFFGPPDADGAVEVGYSVVPRRRRLGLATEAVGALVARARAQTGVTTVVAGCDPDNLASIRTRERLGFARDGAAGGELRWRLAQ